MSTSANDICGRDAHPIRASVEVLAIGTARSRAATCRRARNAACRLVERGRAVTRARVLEPAVDHRDHGARSRPLDEQAAAAAARRTAGRTPATRPYAGCRAHRPRRAARRAAPRPAGPPAPRAARSRSDPTSITGIAHRRQHPRRARRERLAVRRRSAALSVPMRRLAPPVSSTPATWRIRATRWSSSGADDRPAAGAARPQRVADDGPSVGAAFEQHVVAHARAFGAHTRDHERALVALDERVDLDALGDPAARLGVARTRRASPR